MSITVSSITVLPTARPWKFAAIGASAGAATTQVGYNANKTDGSDAGGSAAQNTAYAYGQSHASDTAPHAIAVTPGQTVVITCTGGTVKKDAGGTLYGPIGETTGTAGLSPTVDYTDSSGYVYPTDCMPAAKNLSLANPSTGRVGLVGCFTDSGGTIIPNTFWDFKSRVPPIVLTAAATAVAGTTIYTGTILGGLNNSYAGMLFTITGFATAANNGIFTCVSSNATQLTLNNASGTVQTQAATAYPPTISFVVPTGAAFLSMGINDSVLGDNGGTGFSVTVGVLDPQTVAIFGDQTHTQRLPFGIFGPASNADTSSMLTNVFIASSYTPQFSTATQGLARDYTGQLYPRGSYWWRSGQNFPI